MKKWIPVGLLALCMAMLVLPVRAAAEPYGVYDLQVQNSPAYTLTPLDAWGNGVTDSRTETVEGAERQVFSGVEGFRLTFPGTPGSQYMVFLLQGASSVPGADNVRYTAQQSGGSTTVFEIWPEKLTEGEYHVYLSGTDLSYRQVAGFRVVFFDVPGDVNGDRAVTAADAHLALQQVVKETTLSGKPLSGAEMDGRAGITAMDAALILEKAGAASALYPETVTAAPSGGSGDGISGAGGDSPILVRPAGGAAL